MVSRDRSNIKTKFISFYFLSSALFFFGIAFMDLAPRVFGLIFWTFFGLSTVFVFGIFLDF
jgi:hypothetical protein